MGQEIRKGIIVFLCLFFSIVSSIAIHEYVHVLQYSGAGFEITEVCLLSYQDGEAGWVKFSGEGSIEFDNAHGDEHEVQAYAISIIYFAIVFFALLIYMFCDIDENQAI